MDMFVVRGGRPLRGRVTVSGAKNAALPIMAAALAANGTTVLHGVPDLVDVTTLSQVLRSLGMFVERRPDNSLALTAVDEQRCLADYELVRRMRASVCVLGPLLGRRGRACVSLPGGCNIGHRPIDLHLKGLRALGAQITIDRGYVFARADRLIGTDIYLGGSFGSTVTGTCNVLCAAVFAEGVTTISAAACEPEVVDLGRYLNAMGARIEGLGTPLLRIEGVHSLAAVEHTVIPDRIEAATLLIAATMAGGRLQVDNVDAQHLAAVIDVLRMVGVGIEIRDRTVIVTAPDRIRSLDITALPYPGIPTDVQAQLTALLSTAEGISVVTDKVFPDRFMHIPELMRMGANVRREGASSIISGVKTLSGACVMASDLRASAALLLAALAADGESVIRRVYHLDRGYERLEQKLNQVGADITRVADLPETMPNSLQLSEAEQQPLAVDASDVPPPKFLSKGEFDRYRTPQ
ncbi:UDP-N-acetylglucosamine 1-carboxyvinyltransferase [Schlesneria paludicola]|uniref:UDP-N-acetylglucosamine 1-carboxyvinyltransferase n=1 Tax=Schlesneria paludicola TaxID=360056 RepID=UPI00029ADE1D|nr:UDP-N-acetylglucosamine 1-carboxyvinyltransferase [Schlesneria paludicola]